MNILFYISDSVLKLYISDSVLKVYNHNSILTYLCKKVSLIMNSIVASMKPVLG